MIKKFLLPIFLTAAFVSAVFVFLSGQKQAINHSPEFAATSTDGFIAAEKSSTSAPASQMPALNGKKISLGKAKPVPAIPALPSPAPIKPVSPESFEQLVNGAVIQLYCGILGADGTDFSDIARGTGIIINEKGEILTDRHIIYDDEAQKLRSDCFVLKSPFPNEKSQNPKIYYKADIEKYPVPKFSSSFSKDRYYNDFAVLKIASKIGAESKINLLLNFDYASPNDYAVLENGGGIYNFLPIDWNYRPKNGDELITLGYGADASHTANKITSTIGKIYGNLAINGDSEPQILLIESSATAGFSGGALINPQSKGLVGLIAWIAGDGQTGEQYTAAIFRDFLKDQMSQDLNFSLK